jgi:hypothetical protein
MSKISFLDGAAASGSVMAKLTEWETAMLDKLVGEELVRARESGQPVGLLNDLAALRDTLLRADALHVETLRAMGAARS